MTGWYPVQREEFVVSDDPFETVSAQLRERVDRLVNLAEAKFQYICDMQGNPIRDLDDARTLTLVVNAHGALLGELVTTVGILGLLAAESLKTQAQLVGAVRALRFDTSEIDNRLSDALADLIEEVDQRTLIIPETPGDM